jgi:hypothetical protein
MGGEAQCVQIGGTRSNFKISCPIEVRFSRTAVLFGQRDDLDLKAENRRADMENFE